METKDYDAARLVIENLTMLRQAVELADDVFEEIYKSIIENLNSFVHENKFVTVEKDGWLNTYEFSTDLWVCSGDQQKKLYCAAYYLSYSGDGCAFGHYPLILSDSTQGQSGFYLSIYKQHFNGTPKEIREKVAEINAAHPELKALGFNFDSKEIAWSLPWQLDPKKLSESYPNSLEEAFGPLEEALKKLKEAHGTFEKIIEEVKAAFPLKKNDD